MQNTNYLTTYIPKTMWLTLIIFLEGFVTIATEILTLRQLSPFFGTSVVTSSVIIGFFLFFLACGYYRGGLITTDWCEKLSKNFLKTSILFGIGISYSGISFFYLITTYATSSSLIQLTLYLLCITGPITYLLGQTLPITTNFFISKDTSLVNSQVLGLSTLGSFLGALATSLILMPYIGIAITVLLIFFILGFLILLVTPRQYFFEYPIYFFIASIAIVLINKEAEEKLFVQTNAYANYRISKINNIKLSLHGNIFSINDNPSSFLDKNKKGFKYLEKLKKILFTDLHLRNKNILILGAGGFTLSAENTYQNKFDYVDIDPDIKKIVQKSFLPKINGQFIINDANTYVQHNHQQYDVIISDAYKSNKNIPDNLVTYEYFLSLKQALNPRGYAIFNIIARPTLDDTFSATLDRTIRAVFKSCMVIPVDTYNNIPDNILYICKINNHSEQKIYTNNKNSASLDLFNSLG